MLIWSILFPPLPSLSLFIITTDKGFQMFFFIKTHVQWDFTMIIMSSHGTDSNIIKIWWWGFWYTSLRISVSLLVDNHKISFHLVFLFLFFFLRKELAFSWSHEWLNVGMQCANLWHCSSHNMEPISYSINDLGAKRKRAIF